MSEVSSVRISGRFGTEAGALATELETELNRSPEAPVQVSSTGQAVTVRAETWKPILLARVEDALDEVLGPGWRADVSCA